MACEWMEAKEGYKWILTEFGKKDGRIAAKFEDDYRNKFQYERKVPESWFRFGYVKQVKIDGKNV